MPATNGDTQRQLVETAERQLLDAGMPPEQARVIAHLLAAAGAQMFTGEVMRQVAMNRRILCWALVLSAIDAVGTVLAVVMLMLR
jgi:hypothetical protein